MNGIRVQLFLTGSLLASSATASVVPIGIGSFAPGAHLVTFATLATYTEVNGLVVDGITFTYSLGNGQVIIDSGPGKTNNVDPPNIVSMGFNAGILTITLPTTTTAFGYGFAVQAILPGLTAATTISLFNGATAVGSLVYGATPDPGFDGGFAGIASTLPFDRVAVTFDAINAEAFALDNILVGAAIVPEPSYVLLAAIGLLTAASARRRGHRRNLTA